VKDVWKKCKESSKGKQKFDIVFSNFVSWYKNELFPFVILETNQKLAKSKYAIYNILLSNRIKPLNYRSIDFGIHNTGMKIVYQYSKVLLFKGRMHKIAPFQFCTLPFLNPS
jgi:hypothetical protein